MAFYATAARFYGSMQEAWIEAVSTMEERETFRKRLVELVEREGNNEGALKVLRERRMKRKARWEAESLGLAYWPALIKDGHRPSCDPRAYVLAERALEPIYGLWGEGESRGGWDSKGHYGLSRHDVARMWWAAGCKPTGKFFAQVRLGTLAQKGESEKEFVCFARGWRWLEANKGAFIGWFNNRPHLSTAYGVMSRQAVVALGRLSSPLRWAAIEGFARERYPSEGTVGCYDRPYRIRDLNWARVAQVQSLPKWKRAKAVKMPIRAKWRALKGCDSPEGLNGVDPTVGIKWGVYEAICDGMQVEPYARDNNQDMRPPAWNLARLFGSLGEVKRFASMRGAEWSPVGIHDLGQFIVPENGWTPKEWRRLVFKHPEVLKRAPDWAYIEYSLGHVPKTLTEFNSVSQKLQYQGIETQRDMEVAEIAARVGVAVSEWPLYRDLVRETPEKAFETIPHVQVTGKEVGLEGDWVLRKLDANDPIGPMLGLATNCCQHLTNEGADCARHGYASPWGAFCVVEYKGRVISQAWLWRSSQEGGWADDDQTPHKAVVFDSVEALSSAYVEGMAALYKEAAQRMVGRLGVKEVRFGLTAYGITPELGKYLGMVVVKEDVWPHDYNSYMNGQQQWTIKEDEE